MVAVPEPIPETTPFEEPTVATDGLLVLHEPKDTASARVVAVDWHNAVVPVMAAGAAITVVGAVT